MHYYGGSVKMQNNSRLAGIFGWFRNVLSGFLGLLSLILLSVVLVWPLWYLATNHTYLYSMVMLVLGACFLGFVVFSRFHGAFRNAGKHHMSHAKAGIQQPDPTEPAD